MDTPDAVAVYGDEMKIVPDCEFLKTINFDVKLKNGALILTKNQYQKLKGKKFQVSEIKANKWLTEQGKNMEGVKEKLSVGEKIKNKDWIE